LSKDYVKKGYARVLTDEEAKIENPKTWFLPHFGTLNANKPGMLRLVFHAAATSRETSLNDMLWKGPDVLNSLVGVLMKFRQYRIAFGGDIKEMFDQVNIRSEDLPSHRFLWRGMVREKSPAVMEMSVMTFGSTSSPYSAQYVKNWNAKEYGSEFPEAEKAITERHYVDDCFDSKDTVEESNALIRDVIEVHRRGGFEIRNWMSNSDEVLKAIPVHLQGLSPVYAFSFLLPWLSLPMSNLKKNNMRRIRKEKVKGKV